MASFALPMAEADATIASLLDAMPDAMLLVDRAGTIVQGNRMACELFGRPKSDLIGGSVERLLDARGYGEYRRRTELFFAGTGQPASHSFELTAVRRDGTAFPIRTMLSALAAGADTLVATSIREPVDDARFRGDGGPAHYSTHLAALGELALKAENVDALLDSVPGFIADPLAADIVVIHWNRSGSGLQLRASHGIDDATLVMLEGAGALRNDASDLVRDLAPRIVGWQGAESGIDSLLARNLALKCGVRVPLLARQAPLGLLAAYAREAHRFGQAELDFMRSAANFLVTAYLRSESEQELAHARRLEALGELTGGMAHDFNNILTVVLGNLQMLHEVMLPAGPGAATVKMLASAQRAAKRGAQLTNKLLTFSRKQVLAPIAIDLDAELASLCDMLQRTLGDSIRIEWNVSPACPPCLADIAQLDSALLNLALNARDAMPAGGKIRIFATPASVAPVFPGTARVENSGEYVAISVVDNGQGMSAEVVRRACEPFFTTKQERGGTGLGLSSVHGFAAQSGGSITIDSQVGVGTEVCLYLPAAQVGAVHAGSGHAQVGTAAPHVTRNQTILLVDDDRETLEFADFCLKAAGYRTVLALSRAAALQWLAGPEPVALLFTDVLLGRGETGTALAEEARQMRPNLPVLFTSGSSLGTAAVAHQRPAHFLSKPYERDNLILRIDTLLLIVRTQALLAEARLGVMHARA